MQQNEISREMRLKEKLDKEVKQMHVDMEARMGEIKVLNLQGQKAKEEQQKLEQQLKELKVSKEVGSFWCDMFKNNCYCSYCLS